MCFNENICVMEFSREHYLVSDSVAQCPVSSFTLERVHYASVWLKEKLLLGNQLHRLLLVCRKLFKRGEREPCASVDEDQTLRKLLMERKYRAVIALRAVYSNRLRKKR